MDDTDDLEELHSEPIPYAVCVWTLCVVLLLGPPLLVWIVRIAALMRGCRPGPALCHGMALGGGLRDALALSWGIGSNILLAILIAFGAAVAALTLRRPLLAALSMLLLPISAMALPTLAVIASTYPGCQVNEDGIGDCVLWGAKMGLSFHEAASASSSLYEIVPYSFALALMLGAIGFVFFRPRS